MIELLLALLARIDFWMAATVAIFTLFVYILRRLDQAPDAQFKFHDFFTTGDWNGKPSAARLCYFGAFLVHSQIVLREASKPSSDGSIAATYALVWSGAYVALKFIDRTALNGGTNVQGEAGGVRLQDGGDAREGS